MGMRTPMDRRASVANDVHIGSSLPASDHAWERMVLPGRFVMSGIARGILRCAFTRR